MCHLAATLKHINNVQFWTVGKQTGDSQSTIRCNHHLEMSASVTGAGTVFDRLWNRELKQQKNVLQCLACVHLGKTVRQVEYLDSLLNENWD